MPRVNIGAVSTPFRSFALISREQIAQNYRSIRAAVGPTVEVAGVVKADAYGHGAIEVSRILIAEGARWLAVSSVDEGVNLRCHGIRARVLVLAGALPCEEEALVEYDLTPAVHSLAEVGAIDRLAQLAGKPLPYHLKIDSGMGRLGTRASSAEIVAAVGNAPHARLEGLMTHFASAGDYTTEQTDRQTAYFHTLRADLAAAGFAPALVHMSSSTAIGYARRETWHNLVRVGLAIYGYVPPAQGQAPRQILDVKPVLTWKARILAIKEVPEGALIGYGGSFRAPRPMRVATIGAGYADGVFHRLSNRGSVIAGGKPVPILGAISMDLTTIDISHTTQLERGDEVTLLGTEGEVTLDAQGIATAAGTISYNVLCAIGTRVRRVYA